MEKISDERIAAAAKVFGYKAVQAGASNKGKTFDFWMANIDLVHTANEGLLVHMRRDDIPAAQTYARSLPAEVRTTLAVIMAFDWVGKLKQASGSSSAFEAGLFTGFLIDSDAGAAKAILCGAD